MECWSFSTYLSRLLVVISPAPDCTLGIITLYNQKHPYVGSLTPEVNIIMVGGAKRAPGISPVK